MDTDKPSTCTTREDFAKQAADDIQDAVDDKKRDKARELADSIREEMMRGHDSGN